MGICLLCTSCWRQPPACDFWPFGCKQPLVLALCELCCRTRARAEAWLLPSITNRTQTQVFFRLVGERTFISFSLTRKHHKITFCRSFLEAFLTKSTGLGPTLTQGIGPGPAQVGQAQLVYTCFSGSINHRIASAIVLHLSWAPCELLVPHLPSRSSCRNFYQMHRWVGEVNVFKRCTFNWLTLIIREAREHAH